MAVDEKMPQTTPAQCYSVLSVNIHNNHTKTSHQSLAIMTSATAQVHNKYKLVVIHYHLLDINQIRQQTNALTAR